MSESAEHWAFEPTFDSDRRRALEAAVNFRAVAAAVIEEASNFSFSVELGRTDDLAECRRPNFEFDVTAGTFDAFFNGVGGYRAQYLASPELGQASNGLLIVGFKPKLLSAASRLNAMHEMSASEIDVSLNAASAKVWIDESCFPFHAPTQDLDITLWKAASLMGIEKAKWGLCAPQGTRLQVKGAFIDPYGNEVVPANKIGRRFEIHSHGFT